MKRTAILVVGLMVAVSSAQAPNGKPPRPRHIGNQTVDQNSPVRCDEANSVFVKMQSILTAALNTKFDSKTLVAPSSTPVTRSEVVAELFRFRKLILPKTKLTPKPEAFDVKVLKLADAAKLSSLKTLIAEGYVAKVGPLATGPLETMTVKELGDAVGYFLARTAQLTHLPNRKFSPSIRGDQ